MHAFVGLWKKEDAKNPENGYGTLVANKYWHWYETWLTYVNHYCEMNAEKFR